jgi:hypothetical protein
MNLISKESKMENVSNLIRKEFDMGNVSSLIKKVSKDKV